MLLVPTTQPETVEQYAIRVFDQWKLGRKGVDDGVLLLIAKNDRKLRIEVGRGLEGAIPDAFAKRIIEEEITPRFKQGDFHGGIAAGVDRIAKLVEGEPMPPPAKSSSPSPKSGWSSDVIFYGFLAVVVMASILQSVLGRLLGSAVAGVVAGIIVYVLAGLGIALVVGIVVFLISLMKGSSSRQQRLVIGREQRVFRRRQLVIRGRRIQRWRREFRRRRRIGELVMGARRILKHLFTPDWAAYRAFPRAALKRIEKAIGESEKSHDAELRFAVEAGLALTPLFKGVSPRQRAHEVFANLRVWDTEHNSGVLIYLQLVDHDIEIVADRGISAKVGQDAWNEICRRMEDAFRAGRFEAGALEGIREITTLLARHFPPRDRNPDELPDRPVILG